MKNYQRGYYYLHYYIIRIYERLRFLKNQYSSYRFISNFINSLTNKIKAEFLDKFATTSANIFDKNEGGRTHNSPRLDNKDVIAKSDFIAEPVVEGKSLKEKRMKELDLRSKKLIKLLWTGEIEEDYLNNKPGLIKNFPLTFSLPEVDKVDEHVIHISENNKVLAKLLKLINGQREEENSDINEFINNKIARMKNLMLKPEFQQFLSEEFKEGCRDLYSLDTHSKLQYGLEFLSLKDYIVTIVKINTQKPKSLSNDLKQFVFRILRRFIEEKNESRLTVKPMVDEWESSEWSKSKHKIQDAQNFLNFSEIPELIIESLKHPEDLELSN